MIYFLKYLSWKSEYFLTLTGVKLDKLMLIDGSWEKSNETETKHKNGDVDKVR